MKDGWKQIDTLMKDLRPHLERAGISCAMPTGDLTQIKADLQIKATEFVLSVLDSPEYDAVVRARDLVTEDRWKFYDQYEVTGLQEQKAYAKALADLKTIWNTNRPPYFGKHYADHDFDDPEAAAETLANQNQVDED